MSAQPPSIRRRERLLVGVTIAAKELRSRLTFEAWISNICADGCRLETNVVVAAHDQLLIKLPQLESWRGTVVWRSAGALGLSFDQPLHQAVVEHYANKFPPPRPQQETD